MNPEIEIIENAISEFDFYQIQKEIMGHNFPWHFMEGITQGVDNQWQYSHVLYDNYSPCSSYYDMIMPYIIPIIKPKSLYKIGISAVPSCVDTIIQNPWHQDCTQSKTATLYINTNNGQTRFKTGECIDSIENRMIIFNSLAYHTGTNCTDQNRRIVMTVMYD
jgi:hypothetical protein